MSHSRNPKSVSWIRRLFGHLAPDVRPSGNSVDRRVSFPMLLSVGKDEHDWEPVWHEVVRGATVLRLDHAQLEVRSERGFHTFHYQTLDDAVAGPERMTWEATASLFVGSQLIGRMTFAGHRSDSDLSAPFEQLAEIVDRTEELVPEQLKQFALPLNNEIRLLSVA